MDGVEMRTCNGNHVRVSIVRSTLVSDDQTR